MLSPVGQWIFLIGVGYIIYHGWRTILTSESLRKKSITNCNIAVNKNKLTVINSHVAQISRGSFVLGLLTSYSPLKSFHPYYIYIERRQFALLSAAINILGVAIVVYVVKKNYLAIPIKAALSTFKTIWIIRQVPGYRINEFCADAELDEPEIAFPSVRISEGPETALSVVRVSRFVSTFSFLARLEYFCKSLIQGLSSKSLRAG